MNDFFSPVYLPWRLTEQKTKEKENNEINEKKGEKIEKGKKRPGVRITKEREEIMLQ